LAVAEIGPLTFSDFPEKSQSKVSLNYYFHGYFVHSVIYGNMSNLQPQHYATQQNNLLNRIK